MTATIKKVSSTQKVGQDGNPVVMLNVSLEILGNPATFQELLMLQGESAVQVEFTEIQGRLFPAEAANA